MNTRRLRILAGNKINIKINGILELKTADGAGEKTLSS